MNRTIYLDDKSAEQWDKIPNKSEWIRKQLNTERRATRALLETVGRIAGEISVDLVDLLKLQAEAAKSEL